MKETTRAQIEAMKAQTIGVEIEMHSITRQSAAKPPTSSEPEDTSTQPEETVTRPGALTTPREENGSSRETPVSEPAPTKKNARW